MQLGRKFCIFVPMVQKVVTKHKIQNRKWEILVSKIQTESTMADEPDLAMTRSKSRLKEELPVVKDTATIQRSKVSEKNLQQAWTPNRRVSKVVIIICFYFAIRLDLVRGFGYTITCWFFVS